MTIGYDKNGEELDLLDLCSFTIDNKEYEGIIKYNENDYAYGFEMLDDRFPYVIMYRVDFGSIKRLYNLQQIRDSEELYLKYEEIIQNTY